MVLCKKEQGIVLTKVETKCRDILHVNVCISGREVTLTVVYFSVSEKERNVKMRKEIEDILERNDETLLIIGDFNGHVGFKGDQNLDINGKMILDWMERYKVIMLNDDTRCQGEYTWRKKEKKSLIDYALASEGLYDMFEGMEIDEEQTEFDLSDHNLLKVYLKAKKKTYT